MGLSKVIGIKATFLLIAFYCCKAYGLPLIPLPLLHASIVAYLVAITAHPAINLPLLLGKSSDGKFPLWAMLLFGPFLIFIWVYVFLRRLKSREPVYNEISEGLYVGGWPSSLDHVPPGETAVVDCTCELPRSAAVSRNAYLCIATWDTRAPQPSQIESAVRWACRKRAQKKPVYIHCAHGQHIDDKDSGGKYILIGDDDLEFGIFNRPLPCFGCGIGWFSNYYRKDPRERAGLAASAIATFIGGRKWGKLYQGFMKTSSGSAKDH